MSGGNLPCRICGIAMGDDMNSIVPSLCRWCETSYERMLEDSRGCESVLWML